MYNLNAQIKKLATIKIPNVDFGDCKLQVFPFDNALKKAKLPDMFAPWQRAFDQMRKKIPLVDGKNNHFITIDSQWFSTDGFLRREGIHIDGNFCVDPEFSYGGNTNTPIATWGGAMPTWGGVTPEPVKKSWGGVTPELKKSWGGVAPEPVKKSWGGVTPERVKESWDGGRALKMEDLWTVNVPWTLPYEVKIPFGTYVSDDLGGILAVSSLPGCKVWHGKFAADIRNAGDCEHMRDEFEASTNGVVLGSDECWFMSSNTPHETLKIDKGNRRTFLRITLDHQYPNKIILD